MEKPVNEECIEKEIQDLEREMSSSEWSRGWEKGREDLLKDLQASLFPTNQRILKSAEILFKIFSRLFPNQIAKVYAGYNGKYDEPSMLVAVSDEASSDTRCRILEMGIFLERIFEQVGLLPLSVLACRLSGMDKTSVEADFIFERKVA